MVLSLKMLGEFSLSDESGKTLTLPTRKARALLGYLAANVDKHQPRNRLMALLWGDRSDQQARHSLNQALATLRKLAVDQDEALLEGGSDWIALRGVALDIDLARFHALSDQNPRRACELYKGPFLDGLSVGRHCRHILHRFGRNCTKRRSPRRGFKDQGGGGG